MHKRLMCAALVTAFAVAGCGGSDEPATPPAATSDGMGMESVASTTTGDVKVALSAMEPETFFVSVGGKQREHAPSERDTAHMMVTLADAKSGIRLPDSSVTLRLTAPDGSTAYDGPLYPMIGRGMGMHYGENVALGETGEYRATLVAGPPRIGRHMDAEGAWSMPVRLQQAFEWDGKTVTPSR